MKALTSIVLALSMLLPLACSSGTTITNTITQTKIVTQQSQEITTTITTTQPAQAVTDTITLTITNTATSTETISSPPTTITETTTTTVQPTTTTESPPPEPPLGIEVTEGYELSHIFQPIITMPTDVDVGPDGTIYIAEWNQNRVVRVDLDGTVSTYVELEFPINTLVCNSQGDVFVPQQESIVKISPDREMSVFATDIAPYGGWDFGPSGDLFVGYNGDIYRITPEGVISVHAMGSPGGDMAISPSGDIYLANGQEGKIFKIDTNGILSTLASGFALDAFNIGFDNIGNLYQCQWNFSKVSLDDGSLFDEALRPYYPVLTSRPFVFDSVGNAIFIGPTTHTVVKANPQDGTAALLVEAIGNARGMAIGPYGDLFMGVSNAVPLSPGRIIKISLDGSISDYISGFNTIQDITFDDSGNMYVSDFDYSGDSGGRLLKIDIDKNISTIFSGWYDMGTIVYEPSSGDIIAFETNERRLIRIAPGGDMQPLPVNFGGDEFTADIALDNEGNLIILVVFEENINTGPVHRGLYRISPSYDVTLITDIDTPMATTEDDMFVHPSGDIFVVTVELHPEFQLLRISPDGNISVIARKLPYDTLSIVINQDGEIFFTCSAGLFKVVKI
jgi:sugar lactone lactonase YvrE